MLVTGAFSWFFRATGGPEVAMGTGPWPQPPTEAEQLQALMAAANGESYIILQMCKHFHFTCMLIVP